MSETININVGLPPAGTNATINVNVGGAGQTAPAGGAAPTGGAAPATATPTPAAATPTATPAAVPADQNTTATAVNWQTNNVDIDNINVDEFKALDGMMQEFMSDGQLSASEWQTYEKTRAFYAGDAQPAAPTGGAPAPAAPTPTPSAPAGGSAPTPAPAPAKPKHHGWGPNRRVANQLKRIKEGLKHGYITKAQADKLKAADKKIRAEVKADRKANGGKLTAAERTKITGELNSASGDIFEQKQTGHVDKLEKKGKLTQAQADSLVKGIEQGAVNIRNGVHNAGKQAWDALVSGIKSDEKKDKPHHKTEHKHHTEPKHAKK